MINTKQFYTSRLNFSNLNNEMLNYYKDLFKEDYVFIENRYSIYNRKCLKQSIINNRKKIIEIFLEKN